MIHEQCRNDRDDYAEYRCQNVEGYDEAFGRALTAGELSAATELCDNKKVAEKYGFDGSQFTKNHEMGEEAPGIFDEGSFDRGSVMLYPSNAFSKSECSPSNMDACPMVAIDKVNGKETGKSWIYANVAPSNGDVAFVKKWYPWEGAKTTPKPSPEPSPGIASPEIARDLLDNHALGL